jgi:L-aspartate oxidase
LARFETDVLVIGSGIAGMWSALRASADQRVLMVTKREVQESNTRYAQGGIAAVWSDTDDVEDHMRDTHVAGGGLCRTDAVDVTVREGPSRVRELISSGAEFTRRSDDPTSYDLHQEGGHSHRRILHADDWTGQEVVRALHEACAEASGLTVLSDHIAVDLITESWLARRAGGLPPARDRVLGAYVMDCETGEVHAIVAKAVILATGGAGKVYRYTTNPPIASGDGLAMAWRAGAGLANLEFVQFHPTCLYHPKASSFLISEALRGEGGRLLLPDGTRFMERYDERRELAPRDVVARAIDAEIKRLGLSSVLLDMTHLTRETLQAKFPNIMERLDALGLDMATTPIPVVPAAHYMCGGVRVDLNACAEGIDGLYAVGEVACTGLHGANRLASNSLLEGLVFAHRAVEHIQSSTPTKDASPELPVWDEGTATDSDELVVVEHVWEEVRTLMWNYVGIVRSERRLHRARRRLELIREEVHHYYWDFKLTSDLIELRNLVDVAAAIVECALRRRESRGLHYTLDFPKADPRFVRDTVIRRRL